MCVIDKEIDKTEEERTLRLTKLKRRIANTNKNHLRVNKNFIETGATETKNRLTL